MVVQSISDPCAYSYCVCTSRDNIVGYDDDVRFVNEREKK